jgi:UDP-2,3-diacylglucosamine pyrophosphatase LpxH
LSHSDWFLNWGEKRYAFIHGDTLNYNDSQYLRWKALTHNCIFEAFFRVIPGALARWIAGWVETMLVNTNQEYKVHYPAAEIQEFAESVRLDNGLYILDLCLQALFLPIQQSIVLTLPESRERRLQKCSYVSRLSSANIDCRYNLACHHE